MRGREQDLPVTLDLQDERASAFGHSIVFMRQAYPNMALMTYDHEHHQGAHQVHLVKLVLGIGPEAAPAVLSYEGCTEETTCDNIPGGLGGTAYTVDGHRVDSEILPLILPDEDRPRGGAVVHITSDTDGIFVRFGCGNLAFMHFSPNENMIGEDIRCEEGAASLSPDGQTVTVTRNERPVVTCVRGSFTFTIKAKETSGSYAEGYCPGREAWLVMGFSTDADEALSLASLDPAAERRKVVDYYENKLKNLWIRTPDEDLNGAFRHAYLNLEYAWLYPFGWVECIQHWPTFWHMEQTAAEEWAGNAARARRTLQTQLEYLLPNGAVPDMCANHTGRRDWGGNNHFFFREVLHYLQMTGDREFALMVEPQLERILRQTFDEYDTLISGVLSWHSQIGNQEDFESTPGRGAAPGAEGVRMLEILSEFYGWLGDAEKAGRYARASRLCREQWMKTVWKRDLGRPVWFRDDYGEARLDTTYHGICYPIIYGQLDDADACSALDHLRHRMTGAEGEIYQSNHFGDHAYWWVPTWGMQCGSDMQPFATAAYAKVGRAEDALRPLTFIAKRVCGPFQRGTFPETANEKRFGYFSPSAGVFAQGVIESVFGVTRDRTRGVTTLSPCLPADWPEAELCLPDFGLKYERAGNTRTLTVRSADGLDKRLLLRLPPVAASSVSVLCDGKAVAATVTHRCGWSEIAADLGRADALTITVTAEPLVCSVDYPKILAVGDPLTVTPVGCELLAVEDTCGILDGRGCLRPDLLDEYESYGDFGLVNMARHSFVCRVRCGDDEVRLPCAVCVLPAADVGGEYLPETGSVRLTVSNHRAADVTGGAYLCGPTGGGRADASCPAGGTVTFDVPFSGGVVPGKNRAYLSFGEGETRIDRAVTFTAPAAGADVRYLSLPEELTLPYDRWREIGFATVPHHGCAIMTPDVYLHGCEPGVEFYNGGLSFPLGAYETGRFIPVGLRTRRICEIPLNVKARKLFVLFSAFADDHEICSTLFDAEVECVKENGAYMPPVLRRALTLPGELDFGFGNTVLAGFATYVPGAVRPSLRPALGEDDYDAAEITPPLYPSRNVWCRNHAVERGNAVFNLLEFDLGRPQTLRVLRLIAKASDASGGVFGLAYV